MFKKFYWGKEQSRTVELRFSGYNFLNHPLTSFTSNSETGMQVNYDKTGTLNPNAGYATSKTGGRVVQIALKILF